MNPLVRLSAVSWSLCLFFLAFAQPVQAQGYPSKPIKLIVNYPPGGPTDVVARTVSGKMADLLGQNILIDNQAGGNGVIGTQMAVRSAPDGYTLLVSSPSHTSMASALYGEKLPYDPMTDIVPISLMVNSTQIIVVHPDLKVKTIAELVALAKAMPGKLNFGSAGVGTPNQLGIELLKSMAKIDMVHVAYKGTVPMMQDLLTNRIQLTLTSMATVVQQVQAGKLVALAVGTPVRSPAAPDVPTVAESGYPGFDVSTWFGLFAPAKTPAPIINQLNGVVRKAIADPGVIKTLSSQGAEPQASSSDALAKQIRADYERWKRIVAEAKIVVE